MKTLLLGGKIARKLCLVALVDDEDFERVSELGWHPNKSTCPNGDLSTWYVQGSRGMLLHRFILGITDPQIRVDHRDGNGLNNCRSNLRTGTQSQNLANRPKSRKNTSGFKGVYKRGEHWTAIISHMDRLRHLGTFSNPVDAAKAYDKAARDQWGEFAKTNFQ